MLCVFYHIKKLEKKLSVAQLKYYTYSNKLWNIFLKNFIASGSNFTSMPHQWRMEYIKIKILFKTTYYLKCHKKVYVDNEIL